MAVGAQRHSADSMIRSARPLRRQPFGGPAVALRAVADPLVQAVGGLLPELDAGRQHPEAAPARRPGNGGPLRAAPRRVYDLPAPVPPAGADAALPRAG